MVMQRRWSTVLSTDLADGTAGCECYTKIKVMIMMHQLLVEAYVT
jgi:hypothetical protein